MSMLLEALKKSAAQRQLGTTPTLDSPVGGQSPAGGSERTWIPAVMIILTLVIIGWIGQAQFERPELIAGAPAPEPAVSQQESATHTAIAEGTDRSPRSAKTPVMDFAAVSAAPTTEAAAAARPAAGSGMPARASKADAPKRRLPAAVSATEESLAADLGDNLKPGDTEEIVTETRRKSTGRLESFVADSISYWQVPQSVRENLPELHISVLVYAENPEDRFLLINGQRLHEKEELESGMVLDEIQRDRAIFSYRDYRFYLKN
jgi:general secretion pathway protein B